MLALLVLNVLLGGLCILVARGERTSRALRLWGSGLLVYSAGLLVTLAAFLPLFVSKVAGNGLIAYAPVLSIRGALEHTRLRLRARWLWAAFLVSFAPIVVNHLRAEPSVLVDFLSPAPLANALFVIAAWALLRDAPPRLRFAARFLAGMFLASVLVWTARMVSVWLSIGATNDRDRADLTVALFAIAQIVMSVGATLGLLWLEVRTMSSRLEDFAFLDDLTGLLSRRGTLRRFEEELRRSANAGQSLALAVFDVDHFKRINDTHGHLAGDAALGHVADVLRAMHGGDAVLGRVGGEEFVVLLCGDEARRAAAAAERVRAGLEAREVGHAARPFRVTLSGGVALYPDDGRSWDTLFAAADRRLYAAKQAGRNRIVSGSAPAAG